MMKYVVSLSLVFLFSACVANAASTDFHVRLKVGTDNTPPTTPTSLVATPVAYSQIDLSWGASTDDFELGGYQVFRDATQIATTTLTTYSDTGLTSSTTYTYFVKAYDTSFNISSSSNIVSTSTHKQAATTTPTVTPTVTNTTPPGGSGPGNVTLESFSIVPTLYSAQVTWQTNLYAQFELWWGRTSSYELGFVTNDLFKRTNTTVITDLQPGTIYEYQLVAYDKNGVRTIISNGQFKTLDAPDTRAPANVSNLKAVANGTDVKLSWTNPQDEDFDHVRVMRNYLFYPVDPYDGFIAYQDNGTNYFDHNVLLQKDVQYYTVFSYDKNGNVSSGATVWVQSLSYQSESKPIESTSTQSTSTPSLSLSFDDLKFVQSGLDIAAKDIDSQLPLTIRIPYDKLPEHLKTIQVTLSEPNDATKVFSFLLKINKDKSYYESTIGALNTNGVYPLKLVVYDYQLQTLTSLDGVLTVHGAVSNVFGGTLIPSMHITETSLALLFGLVSLLAYALYQALKDIELEHGFLGNFNKTKMTLSIVLFFVFGGSCAYVLVSILQVGSVPDTEQTSEAAVAASENLLTSGMLPFVSVVLVVVFVGIIALLIKQRGKK